jgi:hypothetical protein
MYGAVTGTRLVAAMREDGVDIWAWRADVEVKTETVSATVWP